MKDRYTNGHSTRVAQYTAMLTGELGYDDDTVGKYYRIALLHDVGSDVVDVFIRLVAKVEFRALDDHGGGTTENIDNIRKAQNGETQGNQ